MFNLKLNLSKLKKQIVDSFTSIFNKPVEDSVVDIESLVKDKFSQFLKKTSFYRSATSGFLRGELGFPDGEEVDILDNFIDDVVDQIDVEYYPYSNKLGGRLVISFKPGYVEYLSSSSILVSENGFSIPWVEWILTQGSRPIITDYRYRPKLGQGRSLEGIMVPGGSWRVPSQFSGTENDNILTRYLEDFQKEVEQDIVNIIKGKTNV